jgi:hypothetical protein
VWRTQRLDKAAVTAERFARMELERHDALWPAQVAILLAIALNVTLPERVTVGPTWLLPAGEALLLAALVAMTQYRAPRHSVRRHRLSLTLVGILSAANIVSLVLLVHFLLRGGQAGGHALILAGIKLWGTNVVLFAVWYWQLDRGGPLPQPGLLMVPDFLFTQMADAIELYPHWKPGFVDYLYLSLTNATAFSPTDTMPLTARAKVLMALQSTSALLTIGLVIARAVNILG